MDEWTILDKVVDALAVSSLPNWVSGKPAADPRRQISVPVVHEPTLAVRVLRGELERVGFRLFTYDDQGRPEGIGPETIRPEKLRNEVSDAEVSACRAACCSETQRLTCMSQG